MRAWGSGGICLEDVECGRRPGQRGGVESLEIKMIKAGVHLDGIAIKILKFFETATEYKSLSKEAWRHQVWDKVCEVVPRGKIIKVNVTLAFIQKSIESGQTLPTL